VRNAPCAATGRRPRPPQPSGRSSSTAPARRSYAFG
jgi:hypothetical protein